MKLSVASLFLVISIALLAAIAPAQTKHRKISKSAPTPAGSATLKICQGLPIPPGYMITAYMSMVGCPHGAYLLKKLDPEFESPRTTRKDDDAQAGGSVVANKNSSSESSVSANKKQQAAPPESVAMNRDVNQPATTSVSASRPRRVGTEQADNEIPVLQGAAPKPPLSAPTLTAKTPIGTPVNAPSDAVAATVAAPGPEEVGEGDVLRVDTSLVSVPVSVQDRLGRFISDLRREDFSVFENGIEQPIAYFEPAEKPFTVALVLDTSPSTQFHLWEIKDAAIAFASQLRPQDRVLVVTFDEQVLLLTEATNDLNVVNAVINQNAVTGNATRLYDAVDLVIKERLNKIKGRKAIVLFTDGVDTASNQATYESTQRGVEELDALIYPIKYDTTDYMRAMQGAGSVTVTMTSSNGIFGRSTSSQTVSSGPSNGGAPLPGTTKADYDRADRYLHELADKTSGRIYQANNTAQLAQAFSSIAEELRRQYSIGYYPQNNSQSAAAPTGERREIKVRVHRPNVTVRARESYLRSSSPSPAP